MALISTGSLFFSEGTSELKTLDKTYNIEVRATNFMGTESPVLHRAITKKSVPFPQFFFTPPMQTKYIDEKVEIRVETGFSVCPDSKASM